MLSMRRIWIKVITSNLGNKELYREAEDLEKLKEALENFVNGRTMTAPAVSTPENKVQELQRDEAEKTIQRSCGTFQNIEQHDQSKFKGQGFSIKQEEAERGWWKYNTELLLHSFLIYGDWRVVLLFWWHRTSKNYRITKDTWYLCWFKRIWVPSDLV